MKPQRVVTVTFQAGGPYTHVTMATGLHEAVANAWRWFQSPHWKGPRPTIDTPMEVIVTGSGARFVTRARALSSKALDPQ